MKKRIENVKILCELLGFFLKKFNNQNLINFSLLIFTYIIDVC